MNAALAQYHALSVAELNELFTIRADADVPEKEPAQSPSIAGPVYENPNDDEEEDDEDDYDDDEDEARRR